MLYSPEATVINVEVSDLDCVRILLGIDYLLCFHGLRDPSVELCNIIILFSICQRDEFDAEKNQTTSDPD